MSSTTLLSFIQGIVADLQTVLAPFGVAADQVETHFGIYDMQALKRFGAKCPAARVAVLGGADVDPYQGELHAQLRIAVYLVTRDGTDKTTNKPIPRDVAMLGLVQAVVQRANANGWSQGVGDQPVNIAFENLYSDDQAAGGLLLYAVSFTQGVNCDLVDPTTLASFITFTNGIDVAGDPSGDQPEISQTDAMPQ